MSAIKKKVGPQGLVFHGTTEKNALQIFADGWIGSEYFEGYDVYVTPNLTHAQQFGPVILVFDGNKLELWEDDVNDGLYHIGKITTNEVLFAYNDMLSYLNEYQQSLKP